MAAFVKKGKICNCTMGAIFLARDEANTRDIVLKELSFPQDQSLQHLREFVAHIDDARKLRHENIIATYGIIHKAFDISIAMELMRCKTLQQKLDAGASFSINAVLSIGIQLTSALQYAHDSGIYHGSVNAHHVYLRKDGLVKLNNFGFNYSIQGVAIGPPTSRAPEQWESAALTRTTDVYGLGIMLYQLLSGRFPYRATNAEQLRERVLTLPPLPLESLAPKVPFKLHQVIMKAIEKDPAKRFQTMLEMEIALRDVASTSDMNNRTDAFLIHELNNQPFIANDIDFSRTHWPLQVLNSWPTRHIRDRSLTKMIDWLLDPNEHSEPFTGVAVVDLNTMLMCWRGFLIACIDLNTHRYGNALLESLPGHVDEMTVFTPVNLHLRPFALLLATILRDPEPLYDTLHSDGFVASEFISKLEFDQFTGVLQVKFAQYTAWIGFESGVFIFMLKNDYSATPFEKNAAFDLLRATHDKAFTVDVYGSSFTPLQAGLAVNLRDAFLQRHCDNQGIQPSDLLKKKGKQIKPAIALELKGNCRLELEPKQFAYELDFSGKKIRASDLLERDHSYRFCHWLLNDLYIQLLADGHKDNLKYLVTWLPEVTHIRLHHTLNDADGAPHQFDIVTFDKDGKVLHVIKRGQNDPDALESFIRDVTGIKENHLERGDIGAAIYCCTEHADEAMQVQWAEHAGHTGNKSLLRMGSLDMFTGLRSFIRLGPNRGFHLLLAETKEQDFQLIHY